MLQKKITIDKTIFLATSLESILTMPSKEVDSCTEDDKSIVLEGGKHMYCHDLVLCYLCVGCFLIDFGQFLHTIFPKC